MTFSNSTRVAPIVRAALSLFILASLPAHTANAACNLRPGVSAAFDGDQGSLNRPFAGPGEALEVSLRPCDASPGLSASSTDQHVTVLFTPPGGTPTAVVLTGEPDCSALAAEVSSCGTAIGGKAYCVAGSDAALEIVNRSGTDALSFRFPDTDTRCNGGADAGTPCNADADCASNDCSASDDGRTLAGAAAIIVTDAADALACSISDCASASGTIACVDKLYAGSGSCSTESLGRTFPGFTALPTPNVYAIECVDSEPPCAPLLGAEELRIGLDLHGNALLPFVWDGVRDQLEGEPIARIVRATVAQDIELPGQSFVASYSPEGRALDPVFEPKTGTAGSLTLFGSTDAPYTILRVANGSDSGNVCVGGGADGTACNVAAECPGGTCEQAACVGGGDAGSPCANDSDCSGGGVCGDELFDFSVLTVDSGQGPAILTRDTMGGNGVCELATETSCTSDCGGDGACVNYKLEASTPVPLDGLIARDELANFAVTERVDGLDLNNDGDTVDLVMTVRDQATGDLIPLGPPAASCGIPANPSEPVYGRAVVRSANPPLLLPAGATDGQTLAFLEPESGQNNCDINLDDENDDAYLRIFDVNGAEIASGSEITADEAPVINDRALVISDDKIFFRTSEPDAADKVVLRRSNDPSTSTPGNDFSNDPDLSPNGNHLVFASRASNLTSDPSDPLVRVSIFLYNYATGSMSRVSQNFDDDPPNVNCARPSVRASGTVAFESSATNLDKFNQENGLTDIDNDIFVGTSSGNPSRISDTNAGTDPDGHSCCPSIGAAGTAFVSTSTDLIAPGEDTNSRDDIYFKPNIGQKIRISDTNSGFQANNDASLPDIAEDVLVVAFESRATNYVSPDSSLQDVFVYDGTGSPSFIEKISVDVNGGLASSSSARPKISGNGRFVAFDSPSIDLVIGDTNGVNDVFVRDRRLGTTRRVSVSTGGGQANGASYVSSISADGRFIVFASEATNLISDDTNGNFDVFIHDAVARTTIRANVNSGGGQVVGDTFFQDAAISDDASRVAWETNDSSYTGSDTNGVTDVYVREPSTSTISDVNSDGDADDVVLRYFDLNSPPAITSIDVAVAAKVSGSSALVTSFFSDNGFEPTTVPGFRFWDGSSLTTLGFTRYTAIEASDAMFLTDEFIAIVDDEDTQYDFAPGPVETEDANSDGDSNDGYLAVHDVCSPITSCGWSIPTGDGGHPVMVGSVDEPLEASANYAVIIASEAEHGPSGTQLNGDGDAADDVIHVYDNDTSVVTNVGLAAADFVLGEPFNSAACLGDIHLLAFRVPEAQEGANLNGNDVDPDPSPDVDTSDFVLHVRDLVSGTTVNTGQAARPCEFSDCDTRRPYRVDGSKVTFLTLESDQGGGFGQDLSGEGDLGDLVVQSYDFCAEVLRVIDRVDEDSSKNPLDVVDDSRVITTLAGRCDDGPCTVGAGDCEAGSFCEADVCLNAFGLCSRHLSIACAANTDCSRCIDLFPGACEFDDECSGTALCLPQEITAVESSVDADGDGIVDSEDGCPDTFDPSGNDLDGDGVPDACDLQSCRPFPRGGCRTPEDGKASLLIKNDAEDKKDKIVWKWSKGEATTKAEFGDPLLTDTYELCVYSDGLLSTGSVPPGGTCDKNDKKPCWKELSKGYKYKDSLATPAGITSVQFKAGETGKAKLKVGGKGANLNLPQTDQIVSSMVVQLVNNSTGECFDAGFDLPFKKQTATLLKAKGGVSNVTTTTTTTLPPCPDADVDGFLDAACGGLDCYDGNAAANPLQTNYFTVHRGDGSFDYNCDGIENKLIGAANCLLLGIGFCLEQNIPGFISSTPCGTSNSIVIDCTGGCVEITSGTDVEECR